MKPSIVLVAILVSACAGADGVPIEPSPPRPGPSLAADSCALARPDFGGVATAADRAPFAYDAGAPLNLRRSPEYVSNGVEVSAIAYDGPSGADGGATTGLLFVPATRSSLRPGVVLMHGLPGSARNVEAYGRALAGYGAVVVALDAPFARRGGAPLRYGVEDRAEQIRLIQDLQRAVDLLRARVDVDPARVAYVGFSYGGAMGALFVGVERRLATAVLVVGDGGLVSHFTGPEDAGFMAGLSCATRAGWYRAMAPIEPIRFVPNAAPTPLLLQSGRLDELVPVADAEALHRAAPEPKTIRWYIAGHALDAQALRDRHDWLAARIGLDPVK